MSEPYQLFVFVPAGAPAAASVDEIASALVAHGGAIEDDSFIYLADLDGREFEPEPAGDASALAKLARHPTLGAIDFALPEGMVNLELRGEPGRIDFVALSIPNGSFEANAEEAKRRYESIGRRLHDRLGAARTILDWGLAYRGVRRDEELARLRRGEFEGKYDLLDLRRPTT